MWIFRRSGARRLASTPSLRPLDAGNREGSTEKRPHRGILFRPTPNHRARWKPIGRRPAVLGKHEDLLGLDAVEAYFRELYWQKGEEALDAVEVDRPARRAFGHSRAREGFQLPFRSIAEASG